MEISIPDYPTLCVRTLAQRESIDNHAHLALGMCGEALSEVIPELVFGTNKKKQIEELGDFFWYVACFCFINLIEFKPSKSEPEHNLLILIGKLTERVKKEYAYKKDTGSYDRIIQDIIYRAFQLCDEYGLDIKEILSKNIEKLKARYPEKFEEEKAISKNEAKEKEVFETKNETETKEEL